MKTPKTSIDIRLRARVEKGGVEDLLNEYFKNKNVIPCLQKDLILRALTVFFLPLARQYHGATSEQIRQSLIDADYHWSLHFEYLQQKLNCDLKPKITSDEGTTSPFGQAPQFEADISSSSEDSDEEEEFVDIFQ